MECCVCYNVVKKSTCCTCSIQICPRCYNSIVFASCKCPICRKHLKKNYKDYILVMYYSLSIKNINSLITINNELKLISEFIVENEIVI